MKHNELEEVEEGESNEWNLYFIKFGLLNNNVEMLNY